MKKLELKNLLKENKNFTFLWASQGLSQITLSMINFVMATRIYEKTGSTLAVSLLWFFYYLPSLMIGPFSGYFVDKWNLRKVLLYTNSIQALTMLLFLFSKNNIYAIYPVTFLYSLLNQFYYPAEASALPMLVKQQSLVFANSLFLMTAQTSLVLGLGASGILMRVFGKDNPIFLSAIFLFIAAIAVYNLPKKEEKREKSKDFSLFVNDIKIGYSFLRETKIVLFPVLILACFQVLIVAIGVSLPNFAESIVGLNVQDAGTLLILPLGIGALVGTILLGKLFKKFRKKKQIKYGLFMVFLSFIIFSVVVPLLGIYRIYPSILLMFLLGIGGILVFVPSQTLLQENTPENIRGRVFGSINFINTAITLPFLLFTAALTDLIGIRTLLVLFGVIMLFALIYLDKAEEYIVNQKKWK
jgi:MFS family permease